MLWLSAKKQFITFLLLPQIGFLISFYLNSINIPTFYVSALGTFSFFPPIAYAFYPLFVETNKLYDERYENLVIEFYLLKRFLFFIISIFIPYFIVFYFYLVIAKIPTIGDQILVLFILYSLFVSSFIRILILIKKKDFKFYFTKGCCKIISEKEDEFEKLKYLLLLLKSYNKFLEQKIKLEITDIKKLYSIILYKNKEERNQIIESICLSLEIDMLSLSNYLTSIYPIPDSEFYVKPSIFEELKLIGAVLAGAIPLIISIITLINDLIGKNFN